MNFVLENLNHSKLPPQPPPEVSSQSPLDERHERTGSVKFADQSDEGKEV